MTRSLQTDLLHLRTRIQCSQGPYCPSIEGPGTSDWSDHILCIMLHICAKSRVPSDPRAV